MNLGVLLVVLAIVWWAIEGMVTDRLPNRGKASVVYNTPAVHAAPTQKEWQTMAETDMMLRLPYVRPIQRVDGYVGGWLHFSAPVL